MPIPIPEALEETRRSETRHGVVGLLAFIGSGFEHSVANMVLSGSAEWTDLARNLAWTAPGNIVGGGVVVGLAYAWIAGPRTAPAPAVDVDLRSLSTGPAHTNGSPSPAAAIIERPPRG
jgi:hypothetical protein